VVPHFMTAPTSRQTLARERERNHREWWPFDLVGPAHDPEEAKRLARLLFARPVDLLRGSYVGRRRPRLGDGDWSK
jgi:hypothetical protein